MYTEWNIDLPKASHCIFRITMLNGETHVVQLMDDIFVDVDTIDYYNIFKHSQISKIEQVYPMYLLIGDSPSSYYHTPKEVFPELVVGGIYDIIIKGVSQEHQYIYTGRGTLRSIHPHKPDIYDGDTILTCIFVENFFMKPYTYLAEEEGVL